MAGQPPDNHYHRLLVEGKDDLFAIAALLQRHALTWPEQEASPYIHETGGIPKLLGTLPTELKGAWRRLGVVLDADEDLDARWKEIRYRLKTAGIDFPTVPDPAGTIIESLGRIERIGVWLMPDNTLPGMLEDFLQHLVPETDKVWPHAQVATSEARSVGAPYSHRNKAALHCWLAWQEPPGRPFGSAVTERILCSDAPSAKSFLHWLHRLFFT